MPEHEKLAGRALEVTQQGVSPLSTTAHVALSSLANAPLSVKVPEAPVAQRGPMAEHLEEFTFAVSHQFKSSFVSTGVRQGNIPSGTEIILPKRSGGSGLGSAAPSAPVVIQPSQQQRSRLPPPPVPVTELPLYLQPRPPMHGGGRKQGYPNAAPLASVVSQSEEVQRAIAQARAIAERLSAKAPPKPP